MSGNVNTSKTNKKRTTRNSDREKQREQQEKLVINRPLRAKLTAAIKAWQIFIWQKTADIDDKKKEIIKKWKKDIENTRCFCPKEGTTLEEVINKYKDVLEECNKFYSTSRRPIKKVPEELKKELEGIKNDKDVINFINDISGGRRWSMTIGSLVYVYKEKVALDMQKLRQQDIEELKKGFKSDNFSESLDEIEKKNFEIRKKNFYRKNILETASGILKLYNDIQDKKDVKEIVDIWRDKLMEGLHKEQASLSNLNNLNNFLERIFGNEEYPIQESAPSEIEDFLERYGNDYLFETINSGLSELFNALARLKEQKQEDQKWFEENVRVYENLNEEKVIDFENEPEDFREQEKRNIALVDNDFMLEQKGIHNRYQNLFESSNKSLENVHHQDKSKGF